MQEHVLSSRRLPRTRPLALRLWGRAASSWVRPPRRAPHNELADLSVLELAQSTQLQSERFNQGLPCDSRYAYELFRRALVLRDEFAWEQIYRQYAAMVERWVRNTSAFAHTDESSEFFVCAAFARFWRALTPERFGTFPTVAALLNYLQRCAACVVIDSVRARTWAVHLSDEQIALLPVQHVAADEEALARVSRAEFWRCVQAYLRSEAERVVLIKSFVLGMKPADIYNLHRNLFESVTGVYVTKRNVLARLGNNQELRRQLL